MSHTTFRLEGERLMSARERFKAYLFGVECDYKLGSIDFFGDLT